MPDAGWVQYSCPICAQVLFEQPPYDASVTLADLPPYATKDDVYDAALVGLRQFNAVVEKHLRDRWAMHHCPKWWQRARASLWTLRHREAFRRTLNEGKS